MARGLKFLMSQEQEEQLRQANDAVHYAEDALNEAAEDRKRLIRVILTSGVSQAQIAEVLGVSQPRISVMLSDKPRKR